MGYSANLLSSRRLREAASVTAMEPTLLLRLSRGSFEELLDDRPEIAHAVISTLARLLQAGANDRANVEGS